MKKLFLSFASVLLMASCCQKEMSVTVQNNADFARKAETVEIDWTAVQSKLNLNPTDSIVVLNSDGKQIPYQIITEGTDSPVKLIFQADVAPNGKAEYKVEKGSPEKFSSKVFARFVPERKDDFAWENDRVAFRVYGQALKVTDGPNNGIDAWNKRTDNLIIDEWYYRQEVEGKNYHSDYGTGCDYYAVGRSLGAGASAPYVNDTLWLGENYESYKVLDNGPIRTSFRLVYGAYDVDGKAISEVKTITLDAGSQLSKMVVDYSADSTLNVAAGIVKRVSGDSVFYAPGKEFVAYKDQANEKNGTTFLAVVSPTQFDETKVDCGHVIGTMHISPDQNAEYYFGFGWDKWGYESFDKWIEYVTQFNSQIKNPLQVTVK